MRLPEILVHRPSTPVPDSKGRSRWHENPLLQISLSLAILTAGAGLAYQMFFGADRGPQNVPVDNAPASDTIKPPSQSPDNPPKPEAKIEPFDCGILSPEACATGAYIEWRVPKSPQSIETIPVRGMGYVLKPGEKVRIREDLIVATSEYPSDSLYHGNLVSGVKKDGSGRITYIGNVIPSEGVGKIGKPFASGAVVGTMRESDLTVFNNEPYNLVTIFRTEEDYKIADPEQIKNPPKKINNQTLGTMPSQGSIYFDVKPPQSSQ